MLDESSLIVLHRRISKAPIGVTRLPASLVTNATCRPRRAPQHEHDGSAVARITRRLRAAANLNAPALVTRKLLFSGRRCLRRDHQRAGVGPPHHARRIATTRVMVVLTVCCSSRCSPGIRACKGIRDQVDVGAAVRGPPPQADDLALRFVGGSGRRSGSPRRACRPTRCRWAHRLVAATRCARTSDLVGHVRAGHEEAPSMRYEDLASVSRRCSRRATASRCSRTFASC